MIFGFSAKNWLKIRYYMLDLEKSADQLYLRKVFRGKTKIDFCMY